ncbi:unnamed protein product, partial [marine sediment metagenome]
HAWYQGTGFENCCDILEINLDNDRLIPMRQTAQAIFSDMIRQYGHYEGNICIDVDNAVNYPIPIEAGVVEGNMESAGDLDIKHAYCGNNGWWIKLCDQTNGAAAAGPAEVSFHYKGVAPYSVVAVPIFDLMDPRTWIDSRVLGDLWVRAEGIAGAGALTTVKLLADEVVTAYT